MFTRLSIALLAAAAVAEAQPELPLTPERKGYVIVTDTVKADGKTDVSDALQALIDANPNRTLFFPDGVYLLSKPLCTPAEPTTSVDLQLSNYAVLKAKADGWPEGEPVVRLGGIHPANNIRTIGHLYSITGGVIDGGNVADGVSIDSGRETVVKQINIKNTRVGLHIRRGANNGSSDADITNVNIVGNGKTDSVGVIVDGSDNTLTNMRIAHVFTGVIVRGGSNMLRNIHPLYTSNYENYNESCGFRNYSAHTKFDFCYSDNFGISFYESNGASAIYDNCQAWWYSPKALKQVVFKTDGSFDAVVTNIRVGFRGNETYHMILDEKKPGGHGVFLYMHVRPDSINEKERTFEKYVKTDYYK